MKTPTSRERRRWIAGASSMLLALTGRASRDVNAADTQTLTLCTFGDSVLDCARYNERGIHPGQLLVRNDDALFPDFRGKDLQARGKARLEHRAVDGATVDSLARQARGLKPDGPSVAIVTVGGNDLLGGLSA